MKQTITISFALFYWLISMGVGLNLHFCGEVVADMVLLAQQKGKCCCAPAEEAESGCCTDEPLLFQQSVENLPASGVSVTFEMPVQLAEVLPVIPVLAVRTPEQVLSAITPRGSPPVLAGRDLRLSLCSLVLHA